MPPGVCPACGGRGVIANAKTGSAEPCPVCQGSGQGTNLLSDVLFWYPLKIVLTASQVGGLALVTIDNDYDFEWRWIIGSSTGLFSVELYSRFHNEPLMPSPINGENLVGTAQLPFVLPKPMKLPKTATIQGKFNDRSAAGNTIELDLVGYKLT